LTFVGIVGKMAIMVKGEKIKFFIDFTIDTEEENR